MLTDKINELKKLLNTINENLELAKLELLEEYDMMNVKYEIEDSLKGIKNDFGKIEQLKIEKAIPFMRNELKHSHIFVGFEKAKQCYGMHPESRTQYST